MFEWVLNTSFDIKVLIVYNNFFIILMNIIGSFYSREFDFFACDCLAWEPLFLERDLQVMNTR